MKLNTNCTKYVFPSFAEDPVVPGAAGRDLPVAHHRASLHVLPRLLRLERGAGCQGQEAEGPTGAVLR